MTQESFVFQVCCHAFVLQHSNQKSPTRTPNVPDRDCVNTPPCAVASAAIAQRTLLRNCPHNVLVCCVGITVTVHASCRKALPSAPNSRLALPFWESSCACKLWGWLVKTIRFTSTGSFGSSCVSDTPQTAGSGFHCRKSSCSLA